jgi:toxin ParE1/3/4
VIRYRVSATAERDLKEIFLYWTTRVSAETGERVVDRIVERFSLLAAYPKVGRLCPEIVDDVRCFPAGKYLIYYRMARHWTDILHIFHGARDQRRAFPENDAAAPR